MSKIICIMPCYNAEDTIAKAIESIINQDYTNWKLIIVDDASTDKSVNVIKKYLKNPKITLLQNKTNQGCYYSRNRGLYHVKDKEWDWFTIHDADDISHPTRFSVYNNYSLEGDMDYIYGCGRGNRWDFKKQKIFFKTSNRLAGVSFISKKLFTKLGYFDPNTKFGGDTEYEDRYKVIVKYIMFKYHKIEDWKKIQKICDSNQIMICKLPKKYTYLYNMGYQIGNNLTQKYTFKDRENYRESYLSKYPTQPPYAEQLYTPFTPLKNQ